MTTYNNFFGGAFFGGGFFGPGVNDAPVEDRWAGGGGGITQWTIQIPQLPKKKEFVFKRSMENQDRQDLDQIVEILKASGVINK